MLDFDIISPKTSHELFEVISNSQDKNYRFGAGYTDLINDLNNNLQQNLTVINLAKLNDNNFKAININENGVQIGALVTAAQLLENNIIQNNYPVLWEAINSVASKEIRATATIGGNICQASPSGDMSCALVALKAVCEIVDSKENIRKENICDFFRGVKKTSLKKNEILRSIFVPINISKNIKSGYIKVGTRNSMEIAIASIAYHFQKDEQNNVIDAGYAIGAVAPTIVFTKDACDFIIRKNINSLNETDVKQFANLIKKYARPISDIRASAWYREEVLINLSETILK